MVTATLGQRSTLQRTVASVKDIGGHEVDHVVVAPKDKCAEIRSTYSQIRVIEEPDEVRGIFGVLNYALKTLGSNYDFMTFINDDDFWLIDYKLLIDKIKEGNVDVVYGQVKYFDEDDHLLGAQTSSPFYKSFGNLLCHEIILMTQQAMIFRSEMFFKLGGFNTDFKLIADTELWLRAITQGYTFKHLGKFCAGYTIQESQLSSDLGLQQKEHKKLIESIQNSPYPMRLIDVLIYRAYNIRIYFRRILKTGSISSPSKINQR